MVVLGGRGLLLISGLAVRFNLSALDLAPEHFAGGRLYAEVHP